MRWTIFAVSLLFVGGLWNPPVFAPVTHADGSQTWTIYLAMKDIPKDERGLPLDELSQLTAGRFLAHYRFCKEGWSVTRSHIEKKRLIIEGRCQPRSS